MAFRFPRALGIGLGVSLVGLNGFCQSPRIDFIEPFLVDQVLIHFDTEAEVVYELQYADSVGLDGEANWTALFTAPPLPFANHYVIVDSRMADQRYYRLLTVSDSQP
ncbi:MAG: hypothetical protein J0M24_27020 [Verrucomicrobia bacterium]|nr:hypothetical protein [Verrucomicrobiota bacterium]